MLSGKMLMFFCFVFIMMTTLSLMLEGSAAFTGNQISVMHELTGYNGLQLSAGGLLALPKMAVGFFMNGFPKIISWDYSFLSDGSWQYIRLLFTVFLSGPVIWAMSMGFVTAVQGIFQRFVP